MESSKKGWALFGLHLSDKGISRRVGLMMGVCLNDVRVVRGVINLLATNDVVSTLYKDLTEWAVQSTFGACECGKNYYAAIIACTLTISLLWDCHHGKQDKVMWFGCTRSHPKIDSLAQAIPNRGDWVIVSTGIGGLRSNGGTNRARWILYIRINVRGQELREFVHRWYK